MFDRFDYDQKAHKIELILRDITARGFEWARCSRGKEFKVWADGGIFYFVYDDLREAVEVWHAVRLRQQ
jgi:hypothetical protein